MDLEQTESTSNNITCSNEAIEELAALEWNIPLDAWWSMPRGLRARHMAVIRMRGLLQSSGNDNA